MDLRRLVWLAVPLVALVELGLHAYSATRAPGPESWSELRGAVERVAQPGDRVVVAPAWAEPLARQALGERWMPLADVARVDLASDRNVLELSLLGESAPELASFPELARGESAGFRLRRLQNPAYQPALFRFADHVRPPALSVAERWHDAERACPFTQNARPSTGGLPGHVAYPRARFRCRGPESFFVGVTVVDDQRFRPRRCIFAHPIDGGVLVLRFADVPLGAALQGSGGTSYLIARDGVGTPVELAAFVDGREVGRSLHRDEDGFRSFRFALDGPRAERAEVRFEIRSDQAREREFCFEAEMR